jgi:isocitrate dehydrogenase kinase/phosphatase
MRIELLIAQTILQGFDAQYGRFLEVTAGAQQRFEQADWPAVQAAMKQRIHLYDHHVGLVVAQLKCITGPHFYDAAFLIRVKIVIQNCCQTIHGQKLLKASLIQSIAGFSNTAI